MHLCLYSRDPLSKKYGLPKVHKARKFLCMHSQCFLFEPQHPPLCPAVDYEVDSDIGHAHKCGHNRVVASTLCKIRFWLTSEGWGGWHKASVLGCLPLGASIGLSPLLILTLRGSERVLVVPTELLDHLSCLTTPRVARPRDWLLPVPLTRCPGGVGGGAYAPHSFRAWLHL